MARRKPAPSPEAKARKLKAINAREEAAQLQKIRDEAYSRGMRAAARFKAKQEGLAAGMKAEQKKRR